MADNRTPIRGKFRRQRILLFLAAAVLVVVFATQFASLYEKKQRYAREEEALLAQIAEAEEEQKELEDYEAYTGTIDYIISIARSKLGLLFPGEVIFKEE